MNKTLKDINIDYLFLNLTKCKRCLDTNTALENAISKVLKLLGDNRIKIDVNNISIIMIWFSPISTNKFIQEHLSKINGIGGKMVNKLLE